MLLALGFHDIERGGDLNRIDAAGERTQHVSSAELWAAVTAAVKRLPARHPRRGFFLLLVEHGSVAAASRGAGISYEAGRWAWRSLLERIGLPDARLHLYPRRRS